MVRRDTWREWGENADAQVLARLNQIFGHPITVWDAVRQIVADVAERGTEAVLEWTRRIDGVELAAEDLWLGPNDFERALASLDDTIRSDLELAAERIRRFHRAQMPRSFFLQDDTGNLLGQRFLPLERVGAYVPAGRAPLVSTLLMTVVPARVAGVEEVIVASPPGPGGSIHPAILAAARLAGATGLLRAGGAQAIAALAFGTDQSPAVDKIVGPGNIFVTLAKQMVFGQVGIDMLAGPSEVAVVATQGKPEWLAADLLSQAEHDPDAAVILITTDGKLAQAVQEQIEAERVQLPRREIVARSLERHGFIIEVRDLEEAAMVVNAIGPEHLELQVAEPWALLSQIRHAGAVFLGPFSSEPVGDYLAGPNHVLPTGGTARFSSMLGVDDFLRRSSVLQMSEEGLLDVGSAAVRLARLEGLEAHARSIERRLDASGEGESRFAEDEGGGRRRRNDGPAGTSRAENRGDGHHRRT